VAIDGRPETVVCWTKDMTLSTKALRGRLTGVDAINDIVRFNLAGLRARMDAPMETHRIVAPSDRSLVDVDCERNYHLNLVLRFTAGTGRDARVEIDRVRIVANQSGIKRIEEISGRAPTLSIGSSVRTDAPDIGKASGANR
jgi:hypothetical protein